MTDRNNHITGGPVDTDGAARKSVYRASGAVLGVAVSGACFLAVGALALSANSRGRPVYVVGAVLLLWLTMRMIRLGVHVSDGGVNVVNYVRSTRIAWADVAGFDVRPYSYWRFVGHVVRRSDGRAIPILAMAGTGVLRGETEKGRERVQKPVDELNRLLAQQARIPNDSSEQRPA
jgi:hypothetical protein